MSEIKRNVRNLEIITDPYNEIVRENIQAVEDYQRIVNEINYE